MLRLQDLPLGAVRAAHSTASIYIPGPPKRHRWARALGLRVLAVSGLLVAMAGVVGDQSALATLGDGPSWRPALKAADPGVALSPHMITTAGPVSIKDPSDAALAIAKKTDRLPGLALVSPAANPLLDYGALLGRSDRVRVTALPVRAPRPEREAKQSADAPATTVIGSAVSAFAPSSATTETPFDLLFKGAHDRATRPHGVVGGNKDHWWSDRPLPKSITSKAALKCLTDAVYFEARGEPEEGQAAVAQVVINRVKNPAYPDDACSVVYQNRKWYNRCQFTFACDRRKDVVTNQAAWESAERIAKAYASGAMWLASIGAATHYHARHVNPTWAKLMRQVKAIDNHIFYITRGGGWT